jgi:hypothetical protein
METHTQPILDPPQRKIRRDFLAKGRKSVVVQDDIVRSTHLRFVRLEIE